MKYNNIFMWTLYKKDKRGKVLVWTIQFLTDGFLVSFGQLGGKQQKETTKILKGKANRTLEEQVDLEVQSAINRQKDKGYKDLKDLNLLFEAHEEGDYYYASSLEGDKRKWGKLEDALEATLPKESTDAQGRPKPMKCTALQDTKTNGIKESVFKKISFPCILQPKLDGVRCIILWDKEEKRWIALSSSGKSYSTAARFIISKIDKSNLPKNYILDGELYIHGEPLEYLSGLARKKTEVPEHKLLQFHWFDIISKTNRDNVRQFEVTSLYNFYFVSNHTEDNLIKRVETSMRRTSDEVKESFRLFVEIGYEGVIIRNREGKYRQGIRSSEIFKWKAFQDAEYEIVGIELGKRGSEDMVFVFKTKEGLEFKAKPLGTRERKENYAQNLSKLKGLKATVQYLTLSQGGIPQGNPRVKAIRNYE